MSSTAVKFDSISEIAQSAATERADALIKGTPTDARDALVRIMTNHAYRPLSSIIPLRHAVACEELLKDCELSPVGRARALKMIVYNTKLEHACVSRSKMCAELGFTYTYLRHMTAKWPSLWAFTNLIVQTTVVDESLSRVVAATAHAAIHGSDRDRRLYYEAFTGMNKRDSGSSGVGTVIFINDKLDRPTGNQPIVIDVQSSMDSEPRPKVLPKPASETNRATEPAEST